MARRWPELRLLAKTGHSSHLMVETPSGANKGDLLLPDATGRLGQNGSGGGNSEEILAISSSMLSEDAINPLRSLTATTQSPWR